MFIALLENRLITPEHHDVAYLKEQSENKKLTCPDCGEILLYKTCEDKQNHFSHFQSDCTFPFREPESVEHETGKKSLRKWLQGQFSDEEVSMEYRITETNQRSDIYIHPLKMAFEYQCSPIRGATWSERGKLYESANMTHLWILGYSMHKYGSTSHPYFHKLNELERTILAAYGKLYYYDVLTHQFIFLYPETIGRQGVWGTEFFFRPAEVSFKEGSLHAQYEPFLSFQKNRRQNLKKLTTSAKETDSYIKDVRAKVDAPRVLATKKQINYIQYLLRKRKKTIPYKLNGILKEEASHLISELEKNR